MTSTSTQTDLPFTGECPICMEDGFKLKDLNVLTCGHLTCRPCGIQASTLKVSYTVHFRHFEIRQIKCPICREWDIISLKINQAPPAPAPPPQLNAPLTNTIPTYRYDPTINGLVLVNPPVPADTFNFLERLRLSDGYKEQFKGYFSASRLQNITAHIRYMTALEMLISQGTLNQDGTRREGLRPDEDKLKAIVKTYFLTIPHNRTRCVNPNCQTSRGTQRKCPSHSLPIPCCQACHTCCFCRNESPHPHLKNRLNAHPTARELGYLSPNVELLMDPVDY